MNTMQQVIDKLSSASHLSGTHLHYRVYGRQLCSGMPLPELPRARFRVRDVAIRCLGASSTDAPQPISARPMIRQLTSQGDTLSMYDSAGYYLLRWEGICDFHVARNGDEVLVQPTPQTSSDWIRFTLYGVVLAFSLHLRGIGNLHASSVVLPTGVIGFLGKPGTGKSSLGAAFAAQGFQFLADDVLAIQQNSRGYIAHPGFPFTSLSSYSINELGLSRLMADSTQLPSDGEKTRVAIEGGWASFCSKASHIQALFVLQPDARQKTIELSALSRAEAVHNLLEHTNCLSLLPKPILQRHLVFLAQLTASIPVWRLAYPSGFKYIPGIIDAVVGHAG
jgi:hypothetical protein